MKKILCIILALTLCAAALCAVGVTAWASDEADPTDTPAAVSTPDVPDVTEAPTAPPVTVEPSDPEPDPDTGGDISALEVATVPVLVVICFGIGQCIKPCNLDNKWIPAIMVPVGGVLGFVAYHVMADFPASDPVTAVAVGVASGLAATGLHQVYKQLKGA